MYRLKTPFLTYFTFFMQKGVVIWREKAIFASETTKIPKP